MTRSIYWFRRDLRIHDNAAIAALTGQVLFVFIFTPEQTMKNQLRNDRALYFIFESLADLGRDLAAHGHKLHFFYGRPADVLKGLAAAHGVDSVICGRDYTPYSVARDAAVGKVVKLISIENMTLLPVGTILTGAGAAYVKYTPFYNAALQHRIPPSPGGLRSEVSSMQIPCEKLGALRTRLLKGFVPSPETVRGGRAEGLKRLKSWAQGTTKLSAYINRGCLSPREVHRAFKKHPEKIRELWWREFYINLVHAHPNMLSTAVCIPGNEQRLISNRVPARWTHVWSTKVKARAFSAWCQGRTGYPLIDASMKEMNETGFMHNRGRMLCAEFLCKRLFIHWEYGERYFAAKLVDYDAAQNACNWMWVAFVQPYFRLFNPLKTTPEYMAYLGDRLKAPTGPKVPILSNKEVIARYERGRKN